MKDNLLLEKLKTLEGFNDISEKCTKRVFRYIITMVYISTYGNPLYSTSDLRQIRYTTHPTSLHMLLQLLDGLVAAAPGSLACSSCCARPPSLS